MNAQQIIQAAIPNADESTIDHILWGRTPFPCGPITARSLYKAAYQYKRACDNKISLCDFCDQKAVEGKWLCVRCEKNMASHL